ncbi:hypothetical protein GFK91_31610 (plasmid) [Roseibium aggregatum]|uniref:hypothetical protein n=1 Tax=Roseibium aggregatum TaxID=187304 RepID=UPI001E3263EB|nr:hypothetical protein [Roseibium aggregatum]UES60261.1 hypothetical protein GFK91_31610 [Roseibium aggregatum]
MKISKAVEILLMIHEEFGDIEITGGTLTNDTPLKSITVTDTVGREIWPRSPTYQTVKLQVDGVFLD